MDAYGLIYLCMAEEGDKVSAASLHHSHTRTELAVEGSIPTRFPPNIRNTCTHQQPSAAAALPLPRRRAAALHRHLFRGAVPRRHRLCDERRLCVDVAGHDGERV